VLSITIVSDDTTIWSVTYDRHYDDRNSFIIQATSCFGYLEQRHKNRNVLTTKWSTTQIRITSVCAMQLKVAKASAVLIAIVGIFAFNFTKVRYMMGENQEVVWPKCSTLDLAVLLNCRAWHTFNHY
jgi:hypothetical protein